VGNQSVWVTEIESVLKDGEFRETTEEKMVQTEITWLSELCAYVLDSRSFPTHV
jgi:hypothetical protein